MTDAKKIEQLAEHLRRARTAHYRSDGDRADAVSEASETVLQNLLDILAKSGDS